jgi:hypothetical protein
MWPKETNILRTTLGQVYTGDIQGIHLHQIPDHRDGDGAQKVSFF